MRRPATKWLAQAAAVAVLVGGAYVAGDRNAERVQPTLARIDSVSPANVRPVAFSPLAIAETRVVDASALSPVIEGRPNITNVQFLDDDASDQEIKVSFDITSRWTVTGDPKDKAMVRLASYMLENEDTVTPRAGALEWVRRTYSDPANADPEIATALAKVLSSDSHEGVRIRAVETLTTLPPAVADDTREALINALQNDPNPAVRIKAVEALAKLAQSGASLDAQTVDTLRQKAVQSDEVMYVRVKAAEALGTLDNYEH
jgi:HEAT repeat protein